MISITHLSYFLGDRALFDEANFHIKPKDKIGLIGLNGTGKSTLLKLIHGDLTADGGEISKSNDCSIGFLNQDMLSYQSGDSILHVAMEAFKDGLAIQQKMDRLLKEMEENYHEKQVDELAKLQDRFESLGGYSMQAQAEEILEGIGFKTRELNMPLKNFSGGWRMRVMLAKLLLEKPSLLMLDEPTNHLDLPSIQWFENYLKSYEGAVIIVSHDRRFLDNTVESIVEVSQAQLNSYAGNYSFYLEEKELRNEIQKNAFENQQQKIKQTERFIERFRAKATKARQVQSRVKSLERMDKVDDVLEENAKVNFAFNFKQKSGRFVTRIEGLNKSFPAVDILENASGTIERGDKIALIGANGKGKSTLLRIIAGTEKYDGTVETGYNVIPSFYAQHQLEALNIEEDILGELKMMGTGKTELEIRKLLGAFLFSDDDVFKKIKVLSGGEKSRVALAKCLLSEANFLLLDEPTNHLDMQSVNILSQALQQYEGTFILVSHDRHFISQVANKIWYIEGKDIKVYPGTYEEFEYWWENKRALPKISEEENKTVKEPKKPAEPIAAPNEAEKSVKKNQFKLQELEKKIGQLEGEKNRLEEKLSKPECYSDINLLQKTTDEYDMIKNQLLVLNNEWEELYLKSEK